jgi:cytochrome c-type biogenesis protein CcmH/NrfG
MSSDSDPPPNESQPRTLFSILSAIPKVIEGSWIAISRGGLIGLTVALSIAFWPLISDRKFVIGEFSVPEELRAKGMTGNTIARRLYEHITEIQRIAKAAVAAQQHDAEPFASTETVVKGADIKFLGAEINLGTLLIQLRTLLGKKDTQIVGEVIVDPNSIWKYRLEVHAIGEHAWTKRTEPSLDIDGLLNGIAVNVVEKFDPLSAGYYFYLNPNQEKRQENLRKAIALADTFQAEDDHKYRWAMLLRSLAERVLLNQPVVAASTLCKTISQYPSFTPAWRALGDALRSASADRNFDEARRAEAAAQAEDLAARLIQARPDEPEGWRQLGNVHQNCSAGPEDETRAKSYFDEALSLQSQRPARSSDYVTLADYARWHYNRLHLKEANDYFRRAQALAPDQQSVYTTFARTLGYPDADKDATRAERYLMARTKANGALSLPGQTHFAQFVMGELLTDEGTQRHVYSYTFRKNFEEAQSYLENAQKGLPPQPIYKALYARALAGQTHFEEAVGELAKVETAEFRPDPYYYLVEWVHGELLYNWSLKLDSESQKPTVKDLQIGPMSKDDRTQIAALDPSSNSTAPRLDKKELLEKALEHFQTASKLRPCGPRSDVIQDLIKIVQGELKESSGQRAEAVPLTEGKSAIPGSQPGNSSPNEPVRLPAKPGIQAQAPPTSSTEPALVKGPPAPVCEQWGKTLVNHQLAVPAAIKVTGTVFPPVAYP